MTLQSRVARTARHHKMLTNWILRDKLYSSYCRGPPVREANSRQALETAQKLSNQLRIAEDRIAELEAEIQHYREKSERAEEWLGKISMEIADRLIKEPVEMRPQMSQRG
jgi:predicted ribosome quality control (RQC) complex YloA/Tae2 family protein